MKKIKIISILFILAIAFTSCENKLKTEITYMTNVPVYMSEEEFKASLKKSEPREIERAGKIYLKDNYLLVNEVYKGIHVFDNSNPASPHAIGFISIPGNVDMATKGDLLYVDSSVDLVVLDISDISNPVEVDRIRNAFPNAYPEFDYDYPTEPIDKSLGVVVGWEIQEITTKIEEEPNIGPWGFADTEASGAISTQNMSSSATRGGVAIAGSMARFAVSADALYAINNNSELKIFDISQTKAIKKDSINTMRGIETLFVYENKLFIGSNTGMFIYDIRNSKAPEYISEYRHVTSCDPVVVNGDYAYVTLRTGNNCMGSINELHVLSLADIEHPSLVKAYDMTNPHGLGIDGSTLFLCDGSDGLKIYDATDVNQIDQNLLAHFNDINTFDVIPYNNVLIMTGKDGIFQYDYSDLQNINEISHIVIKGGNSNSGSEYF